MAVSDFGSNLHGFPMQAVYCHPVQFIAAEDICKYIFPFPNHHFIGLRPYLHHKHRVTHGQVQPFPLAYGIMRDSLVPAKHIALQVDKISLRHLHPGVRFYETGMVVVRYETDFLAVRLVGHLQSYIRSHPADFFLVVAAHGHQGVGQLFLGQVVQGVGLVLFRCHRSLKGISLVWEPADLGIMAGCDVIRTNRHAPAQQRFPLHITVAGNTRVRGSPSHVFAHEIVHHIGPELFLEIHYIIRDTEVHGNPAGIIHSA